MAERTNPTENRLAKPGEHPEYLSRQLITYLGNKRSLLAHFEQAILKVKQRLGKPRLHILDAFAGSGVVSRLFKRHAERLVSNDLESFASVIGRCFLRNRSEVNWERLHAVIRELNTDVDRADLEPGFIEEMYAPRDESCITLRDRVFYTRENARRLDNYRRMIESLPCEVGELLLGPLLSEASIHANTAGVFKGFYKDRLTGIGKFGGSNSDALSRIKGRIELDVPVLSRFECDVEVHQQDANALVRQLGGLDLAYFDPPYNQHPYGSNYFMLNLIVDYRRPQRMSDVSGIPTDWKRSDYNVRRRCRDRMADLVRTVDSRFILLSFNDEGFIAPTELVELLAPLGTLERIEIPYNTFRGSRNLRNRSIHVTEQLFLLERY